MSNISNLSLDDAIKQAVACHTAGQLHEAERLYRAILRAHPAHPDANHNLGVLARQMGQLAVGLPYLQAALASNPLREQFSLTYADALMANGQPREALGIIESALRQGANSPAAESLRKRAELAVSSAGPAATVPPGEMNRLVALFHAGHHVDMESQARQLLGKYPHSGIVWKALGASLYVQGKDSLPAMRKATEYSPDDAEAHNSLGIALYALGRLDDAVASYRRALEIKPAFAEAHGNLGIALNDLWQLDDAVASCRLALTIKPDFALAHNSLGNCLRNLGRIDDAVASYLRALEFDPFYAEAHNNLLFTQNYLCGQPADTLLAEAMRFGKLAAQRARPFTHWRNVPDPDKRLRVGIVSGDLRDHPVAYFVDNVLVALVSHAAGRVELFAYSSNVRSDSLTEHIKACCHGWHSAVGLSDEGLARKIREDGIDILIDLAGHTAHNRLPMFAWKPAPVQVSWLGYVGTTGLSAMDYYLADPYAVPESHESQFVEKVWRMPDSMNCFTPPAFDLSASRSSPTPALTKGYITFGSFNNLTKLNDAVVALWCKVLHQVSNSKILLNTMQLNVAALRETTWQRFAAHGIGRERVMLECITPRASSIAAYARVDIALDPFPYGGGTTTAEALWMGVPVLTLAGERLAGRMGVSQLSNVGLPDWIAEDEADYVEKAKQLADIHSLAALREKLGAQVMESPLFDAPRFAGHFAAALRSMWQQWCGRQAALQANEHTEDGISILGSGNGRETHSATAEPLHKGAGRAEFTLSGTDAAGAAPTAAEINRLISLFNAGHHMEMESQARQLLGKFPHSGSVWQVLGASLYAQGKDALPAFRRAAEYLPHDAEAQNNLGSALKKLGKFDEAVASFLRALTIKPAFAEAHYNLGNTLENLGQVDEAVASFRRAIEIKPDYAEAHCNLGNALSTLGLLNEAAASYHRAIEVKSDFAEAHNNLGNVLKDLGQFAEAVASCRRALAIRPDYAEAHSNLGNLLTKLGQLDDAVSSCQRALAIKPDYVEGHCNLAVALNDLGRFDEAMASCRRALEIDPDFANAHCNLGHMLNDLGRLDDALASYRRALELEPDFAEAHSSLGNLLANLGLFDDAVASYRRALAINPDLEVAHNGLLFVHNYLCNQPAATLVAEARRFGDLVARKSRPYTHWANVADPNKCLRVGLVSGDLRKHPVGYFVDNALAALANHAAGRVELIAYSCNVHSDSLTERIESSCHGWHLAMGLSDEGLARKIREDGIDILIDLAGHTAHNRLPMFAWKPAPVQATWLGYFATTGVAAIDYLIADPWTAPPGGESHFTETIQRLPEIYYCFTAPETEVCISALPALANGDVTFGCFNNLTKMNDAVVALWARVLHAVPESRLFLKSKQLSEASVRAATWRRFADHGIDESRLILEGASPRAEYLAAYNRVDIALDPFPYPGGTTTFETLWMGVPVLTLAGDRFLSHVGESIMHNAGLPEWIAADADDYVARAVSHSRDLARLAELRQRLRQQVLASPLFDAQRFAGHFETALRSMWEQWCDRQIGMGA